MRAAQDGDNAAYATLLRELLPQLRQAVRQRRSFLQPQDIEDLVQDILLSLHAVRATYDPSRPFRPWLSAIVHNRMVDGARRYARRAQNEVAVGELPETFSPAPSNMTTSYRDPEALRQAVQLLPRGQREAIEMLKLRELSLKEASAATGTSVGALKVAAHRGMLALRKALNAGGRT
jgi:RNA polymerase sigma-70 factor (ECF subfamily)